MDARSQQTVMTLGNATALVGLIIGELAGNEISNTLEGSELSQSAIYQMACSSIVSEFKSQLINGGN